MISSLYIFMKSIRFTASKFQKFLALFWCFAWSVFYALTVSSIPFLLFRVILCTANIIFAFLLIQRGFGEQQKLKKKQIFEITVSAYLFAFGISYILNYIAGLLVSVPYALFMQNDIVAGNPINYNQPIYLLLRFLTLILQLTLAFLIFRVRRLRKGFPFIFSRFTIVAALLFSGIILIIVSWVNLLSKSENIYRGYNMDIAGLIIAGVGIYILIRRLMKIYQLKRVRQNSDDHYERLWIEEKEKNERLCEASNAMHTALHKFTSRIDAMEAALENGVVSAVDIQNLQKDWQNELSAIKGIKPLKSTNITALDNLFAYFAKQFMKREICFNLVINGSIIYMTENIIDRGRLETLIADHLKDAQIAVDSSPNPYRGIMAVLGLSGEHYEFTVFDSGIPFEVDTLERLGTQRVTTHENEGGSGIGFMTTFETMNECKASLIISEKEPNTADYTKSVTIRFDGKKQYIIETYRPDEFTSSDRYIIINSD